MPYRKPETGSRSARPLLVALCVLCAGCASGNSQEGGSFSGRKLGSWPPQSIDASIPQALNQSESEDSKDVSSTVDADGGTSSGSLKIRPSANQVIITNAEPSESLELLSQTGTSVAEVLADAEGSYIFRDVAPGSGYTVQQGGETSGEFTVPSVESSLPPASWYERQTLTEGFQYIETRDGTLLSASIYLPPGEGPFPTVVEYSGYDPADPTQDLIEPVAKLGLDPNALCESIKIICNKPSQPSSLIAAAMDYAVVAVNMRGTGCSGGAYDFFDAQQVMDGYDVIETVAKQPWVKGERVGMVGLSYPGISQLWVAAAQPPHLAAIAPLSIFDDSARGVLSLGGIFNKGFALKWAQEVFEKAQPLGQGWEQEVIDGGDTVCAENQSLRGQNVDASKKARRFDEYVPEAADPVNPSLFVDKITVPVFSTGAWQDEQTGPRFANLWNKFTSSPVRKFYGFNGAHADGYSPQTLMEWKLFLDFYVAEQRSPLPGFLRQFGPELIGDVFKGSLSFPPDRLLDGDFSQNKAAFEAEPSVHILWDRGSDATTLGLPTSTGESTFAEWPPPGTQTARFFMNGDSRLSLVPPTGSAPPAQWTTSPALADQVTLPGEKEGQAFHALPEFEWQQDRPGEAAAWVSEPLTNDLVMLGGGRADLWIRSDQPKADLGVTLSEVRPDNQEMYVQSGFLRARFRAVGPRATELNADHSGLAEDAKPLTPGRWEFAPVEILPVGHVFRAGSRVRISVHTPGGDKPRWSWILDTFDQLPTIEIGNDAAHPSSIALASVQGVVGYQPDLPACPGQRGQPCRRYQVFTNQTNG